MWQWSAAQPNANMPMAEKYKPINTPNHWLFRIDWKNIKIPNIRYNPLVNVQLFKIRLFITILSKITILLFFET